VVEADVGELLDKAWLTVGSNLEANDVDHYAIAAELMKAADGQDAAALEEAFLRVCSTYGKETLGRVSDKILIYTVQKGWSGACKVSCQNCTQTCPLCRIFVGLAVQKFVLSNFSNLKHFGHCLQL
jgi:hypothetical protein